MAGSFNPETNGLDMNNLIEALQTIMDAAQGLRNFNNEVSDSTRKVSNQGKAAQDFAKGLAKEAMTLGKEMDRTTRELKRVNDALPHIVKNTMSTVEKNFAFTSQELNRNFKLDKWMNPVFNEYRILQKKSVKEFEEQLEDIETALASVADEVERASLKYQKDLIEERKENVKNKSEWQLMASDNAEYWKKQSIKAGKKVLGDLYNFAKSKINSAVSSYASTMQSTYTTIQSYNNYTEKQYNQMFKRLQKSIDDAGLNNIININELQQQYTGAIQGGLTGKNAETNAYYAQIAKQAGVTFDWNDSNWLKTFSRMSKQGNDMEKLSQDIIVATENMMEAAGNGFAFTNGQINSMVDSLNQLQGSLNLTDEAYIAAYKSFGTAGSMLNEWGIDATKIYADITEYATKGITSGATAKLLNMGGLTQAEAERKIEAGETDDIVIKYLTELQNRYDKTTGEFVNVASSALNESLSTEEIQAYQEYVKYLSDNNLTVEEEFKRIYDYDKWAYDKMIESLENSETGQDKIQNKLDNIFDEIGKFTAMHPILTQIAQSVMTVAEMAVIGYFMGGTDSTGGRTIQTLLNKIFRRGGSGGAAGPQAYNGQPLMNMGGAGGGTSSSVVGGAAKTGFAKLFTNGAQGLGAGKAGSLASKITSSKIGSTIFSTGGKALGVAGSLISMGIDGYQGYQEDGWAGAARGAITGSGKKAETGWDVAKGAGSGALKGAGIGMVFGPWGAAIGAAVGAAAGLAITLTDLNDEEAKYQRKVEAAQTHLSNLATSVSELSNATAKFESEVKKTDDIKNFSNTLSVGQEPAAELLSAFPELTVYLDKNGKATSKYIDELQRSIELQNELNEIEYNKVLKEKSNDIYGTSSSYKTVVADFEKSEKEYNKVSKNKELRDKFENDVKNTKGTIYRDAKGDLYVGATFDESTGTYSGGTKYTEQQLLDAYGVSSKDTGSGSITKDMLHSDITKGKITANYDSIQYDPDTKTYSTWASESTGNVIYLGEDGIAHVGLDKQNKIITDHNNKKRKLGEYYATLKANAISWNDAFNKKGLNNISTGAEFVNIANDVWDIYKYPIGEETQGSFVNVLWNYNYALKQMLDNDYDTIDNMKKSFIAPSKLLKLLNDSDPSVDNVNFATAFAVGTTGDSTIPYDNYLAYLHKGEQVRTAAEVAVERAEQHVASSNAIGQLNSAVMQQTNTIISLLTQILSVTTSLAGRVGAKPAQSYDYSPVSI